MSNSTFAARGAAAVTLVALATLAGASIAVAQAPASPVKFTVKGPARRLEMTVNTSRIVDFPFDVPRMLVNNPELVRVIPISPKSIQISAVRAGVTQLNVWDTAGKVTSLDLTILGDVAELDMTLKALFPEASIRLRPLNSSLYISGYVPKAEMVQSITNVARDYFPNIINDMTVGGIQKVLLHVKVMEVSRTKLRTLGFDWNQLSGGGFITQTVGGSTGTTVNVGIGNFEGFLEALRQYDLAKLMAEPTLTTLSGRPASFNVGGEVPIPVQQSVGVTAVQYREFGTRIDFVPIVLGNGVVRLEVRPEVKEIDPSLRDEVTGTPGFRLRRADTAVEMKAGQTLAIAGLVYSREESINRGIPVLSDLPCIGVPFRRVSNRRNEVELLIFVTPEFCEAMDPNEVPPCGPGQLTTSPTDKELYCRGYLEVPIGECTNGNCGPGMGPIGPTYEEVPAPVVPMVNQGAANTPTPATRMAPLVAAPRAQAAPAATTASTAPTRPTLASAPVVVASPVGMTAGPQNPQPVHHASPVVQKPTSNLQPALIGPVGYDELK